MLRRNTLQGILPILKIIEKFRNKLVECLGSSWIVEVNIQ